ncbi:hypothetical protein AQUCO_07000006v1 [Aquilegia coerulea]|uniref:Uncharacterized protein n=1 Tax=Aquilegia coerulea TaxID=218851 RepID=A0A2G5CBX8_AQUCA|nr:hypothetical protein AQUCO_07000006v1 [Aquilegia coerulea]
MRSLKLEAKILTKDMDEWYGSSNSKTRLRSGRRRSSSNISSSIDDDRRLKRRLFRDDDNDSERSNSKTKITNQGGDEINCVSENGSTEIDLMVDKDYMAYLDYIIETFKGDFNAMSNQGGNVDCERVSTHQVSNTVKDNGSSEQILYVGMNGIVYEKIEHGNTNVDSDSKSWEGNLDAPLEMLVVDDIGCGSQSSGEDDVDPDYKIFLDNVREDEYSYIFERKKEDGTTVFLKYEEDNDKLIEDSILIDEGAHLDYNSSPENVKDLTDNDFGKKNGSPAEQPRHVTPHWFLSDCKPGTLSCADESYLRFLDHVWVEGDSLTFKYEGVIVKYGDDSKVAADPEGLQQTDAVCGNEMKLTQYMELKTSNVAMSEDDSDSVQFICSGKGDHEKEFRRLLRKEISKPYDKYEYKDSLKRARVRKWVDLDKETRRTSFSVPTKRKRKSYLGHHPDLKGLLEAALKEHFPRKRALALLRCLFFHVKYRPHPGYFVPWTNPPTWLHDKICCCQGNSRNCPIIKKRHSKSRILNLD